MDELRVSSKLMNHLMSKFIRHKIRKHCGQTINVVFNQIVATIRDGDKVKIHLELDADMNTADFEKMITKALGLGGDKENEEA